MADRVDFGDEDNEDEEDSRNPRAVTCRYDMAKLRKIGEVRAHVFFQRAQEAHSLTTVSYVSEVYVQLTPICSSRASHTCLYPSFHSSRTR